MFSEAPPSVHPCKTFISLGGWLAFALTAASGSAQTATLPDNLFLVEQSNDIRLDSPGKWLSYRFAARQSNPLTNVEIYVVGTSGLPLPLYLLEVWNDDGGGRPGASLPSNVAFTPGPGWNYLTLSSPVNLTAGVTYHLVIRSSSASNTVWASFRTTSPHNALYPQDGSADAVADALDSTDGGATWNLRQENPPYILFFNGGSTFEGNSYANAALGLIHGNATPGNTADDVWRGQRFFNEATRTVDRLRVRLRKDGTPASDLLLDLVKDPDGAPTTLLQDVAALSPTAAPTAFSWVTVGLGGPVTLDAGVTYGFAFHTTSGQNAAPCNCYQIAVGETLSTAFVEFEALTYDGARSLMALSTAGGPPFTYQKDRDIAFEFLPAPRPPRRSFSTSSSRAGNPAGSMW